MVVSTSRLVDMDISYSLKSPVYLPYPVLVFVLHARELVSQSHYLPAGARGRGFLYAFRTSHGSIDVGVRSNVFVRLLPSLVRTLGWIRHISFSSAGDEKKFFDYRDG